MYAVVGAVTQARDKTLADLTACEVAILVPVVLAMIWIGVYPEPFLQRIEASMKAVMERVKPADKMRAAQAMPVTRGQNCRHPAARRYGMRATAMCHGCPLATDPRLWTGREG